MASQYWRAFKTAAEGHYNKNAALNFARSGEDSEDSEDSDAMEKQMKDNMTPLLSHKPAAGTNTVLVGHDDPFEMATGIYPEPSGVVYVVKPEGNGKFQVLGKVAPDDWQTLGAPPSLHNER